MVNFIIRDGDKFVLNGNELMRTENPVLEVPDIVGSEEVTEKIAEDVQVGDLLYNVKRDFYPSFQTPPNNFRTYGTKFFEYDDYLHAVISDRYTTGIYKYKNDKWEVAFPKNSDDKQANPSMGGASNVNPGVAAIGTTSGNAYVTYRPWAFAVDAIQPPFVGLAKFDGDILTPLDCLDASDAPNVNKLGDNSYNGVYNPTLYEASGIVHLSFPFRADYLSCGVAQYILNQDTDRLEPVTIDPSAGCGQAAYTSDITEYNNELYLVVGGGPDYNTLGVSRSNIAVWKWNLSAMNWDFYWSNATVTTNDFIRAIKFVKEGGKLYIVGAYNLNPSHDWYILNSSTSSFDSFTPTFSGNIPPQGYGQERMSAARFNGTTYITNFRGFNSDTYASGYNDQLYFGTFDHSTSTLTGSTSSIDGLQLVDSGAMGAVDLIEFNNELHLVCGGLYPNQVVFMKLNQSNNRFERNCAWDIPESADYDSMFDMEFYDFDGSTFGCVTSYGDPLKYFIYDASSTFKKFRILKDLAIAAGGNHFGNKFWEYDGKLYNTIKHSSSPYRTIYEFVPSSLSFEKLATPVDSPSRSSGLT